MQSYRIDFAMNQGHEMTLDRETGIFRNELDEIETQMLLGGRIPFLLPVDWFELDGKLIFRYKLSGMKMLLHRLQQQKLTMEQYYTLILGISDALFECKHYMLRPEGCLLDEQFIFIGESLHDIRLAYVPMKGDAAGQSAGAGDLLSLIVRFTSYIDHIDGEGLKQVLHHLTNTRWPLAELRATLLHLIGEIPALQHSRAAQTVIQPQKADQTQQAQQSRQTQQTKQSHPDQQSEPFQQTESYSWASHQQQAEPERYKAIHKQHEPSFPLHDGYNSNAMKASSSAFVEDMDDRLEESEPALKKKWILSAGLIIGIACVWRFVYFKADTKQSLLISLGITLLLLAAMLFVWRKKDSQHADTMDMEYGIGQLEQDYEEEQDSRRFPGLVNIYGEQNRQKAASKQSANDLNEEGKIDSGSTIHVVAANHMHPAAEPTVLLWKEEQKETSNEHAEWLQRSWEGQDSKLELVEGCFKIGRMGENVSYTDLAGGVSRLHLEIERSDGGYKAKDLGSRNGSLLNGEAMIPYKSYKLSLGDVIQLAGARGPCYELRSG
ncbi:DUF6382 domain-containing protein [Paenibacillus sp. FJAT-27812]|uniref:DUF6382 domain-containing protein n=1 Tax=Paenibacillus sp. FJAT-27812 TaxID=1684143 RepID=UPI0006A783E3|nr:DUF6382 domain-containing protein [Paenibacillus sp. FJAT-27812]